jgi:DNA mismatch repair protein MutS
VAKLAGVPAETIRKAKAYLSRLDHFSARTDHQGDLFSGPATTNAGEGEPSSTEAIAERLRALDPDAMSPREALEALYALRKLLSG